MNALLDQLELNSTFFIELGIIAVLFVLLSQVYFRPFQKLFEIRRKRTIEDKESAERIMAEANSQLEQYKRILSEEKVAAKKEYDQALAEARKEEAKILSQAREEAKKITHDAADSVSRQREQLKKQLEGDVENIAQNIYERLLSRKV